MADSVEILKSRDIGASVLSLRSDGIMLISLKENVTLNLKDAEDMVRTFGEMGEGKKFPLLFIAGSDTSVNTEARYYASTPEANRFTIASAFVVKSVAQKLLGNAYVTFNKPITPTRIFTNEQDAHDWLLTFKK
jgi:hypothetical protein